MDEVRLSYSAIIVKVNITVKKIMNTVVPISKSIIPLSIKINITMIPKQSIDKNIIPKVVIYTIF